MAEVKVATGTVRRNRKHFPQNLDTTSKISRGDSVFAYHNSIAVCRWYDNKDVFFCTCPLG